MNIQPEITLVAAAILLASQVAVIIVLVVLCKKFKTLKDELHKYKVKQNRASLPKLVVKDPKDKTNRPCNEYVDGKRHPHTLVKTNSKESIVYVPTPAPERRSKNLERNGYELDVVQGPGDPSSYFYEGEIAHSTYTGDQGDEIYGNQFVIDMVENGMEKDQALSSGVDSTATVNNDPSTPCIEEININSRCTSDTDEIYGNQVVIDMAERQALSFISDGQIDTTAGNVHVEGNGSKSKKGNKPKTASKKAKIQKLNISMGNERTTEAGDSCHEVDNSHANSEPIYENLRGQRASTEA